MSELNGIYAQYPQVLVNVVANAAQKAAYKAAEVLAGFIENEEQKLMGMGRVLVRVQVSWLVYIQAFGYADVVAQEL